MATAPGVFRGKPFEYRHRLPGCAVGLALVPPEQPGGTEADPARNGTWVRRRTRTRTRSTHLRCRPSWIRPPSCHAALSRAGGHPETDRAAPLGRPVRAGLFARMSPADRSLPAGPSGSRRSPADPFGILLRRTRAAGLRSSACSRRGSHRANPGSHQGPRTQIRRARRTTRRAPRGAGADMTRTGAEGDAAARTQYRTSATARPFVFSQPPPLAAGRVDSASPARRNSAQGCRRDVPIRLPMCGIGPSGVWAKWIPERQILSSSVI